MPPDTPSEVARANAIIERLAAQSPIHGALRASSWPEPYPLITAGLHCTACELNVGGALDLSGEVGPTDGEGAVLQLLELLAARGCTHAASFAISPDSDRDPQE